MHNEDSAPLSPAFRNHLLSIVNITESELDKIVSNLVDHWSETLSEFVTRRHKELQRSRIPNRIAYGRICDEVSARRFPIAPLSERQVRRILYG
tara:strand:+ start:445 stop:726 length:282 start_codon:yes stop_codon:yes gene_type:complete